MYSLDYKILIGGLSVIFGIICYIPYIKDIYKGKTKPHTVSRLIRTLTTGLGFAAQIQDGVGRGAFTLGALSIINLGILIYALKKGETNISKLNYIALILALSSLILWFISKNPLRSIILIIIADSLGFYPTFHKSYTEPQSESLSFWILTVVSLILSLFAMNHISIIGALYTITMMFWEINLIILLLFRKKYIGGK